MSTPPTSAYRHCRGCRGAARAAARGWPRGAGHGLAVRHVPGHQLRQVVALLLQLGVQATFADLVARDVCYIFSTLQRTHIL